MPRQTNQTQNDRRRMKYRRKTLRPHPARAQIVDVMRSYRKPISPSQLAKVTGGSLGSVAYHVRTLVSAGIIELAEEGRVRGAVEHFYVLVLEDHQTKLDDPVGQLLGLCGALTVPGPNGGLPRPAVIDADAREELCDIIDQLTYRVREVAAAATARAA